MLRLLASPRAAGVIGCLTLLLIGWSGLLVPSLIRSIERDFGQTDAGIGIYYLVWAVAYACGSLGGGMVTERLGRRRILVGAALAHGLGLAVAGVRSAVGDRPRCRPSPAGLGAGALDGGANGLILDLYHAARGRALNTLHLFFSIGALSSPLVVGQLVDAGVAWQGIVIATALAVRPAGRPLRGRPAAARATRRGRPRETGAPRTTPIAFTWPLLTLEVAIACYVAAEVGRLELARALPRHRPARDRNGCPVAVLGGAGARAGWSRPGSPTASITCSSRSSPSRSRGSRPSPRCWCRRSARRSSCSAWSGSPPDRSTR